MAYSNSKLINYKKLTKNRSNGRSKIDTITIHCMVAQWTAKECCDYFAKTTRQCSSNYTVGKDGSKGLSVEEKNRAWTSSSSTNDNRAITIEVASDVKSPYKITDKAYNSLIDLLEDICKRNNIKKLVWSDNKTNRITHKNSCNMTVHRDFAATACPGDYLYGQMSNIAKEVNKRLSGETKKTTTTTKTTTNKVEYRVRKSWNNVSSQIGAYKDLENAKKACLAGYSVYNSKGEVVYTKPATTTKKTNKQIAEEVILGKWGSGTTRKKKLEEAGYNYSTIQKLVNEMMK